jgi:hypothetical protein
MITLPSTGTSFRALVAAATVVAALIATTAAPALPDAGVAAVKAKQTHV